MFPFDLPPLTADLPPLIARPQLQEEMGVRKGCNRVRGLLQCRPLSPAVFPGAAALNSVSEGKIGQRKILVVLRRNETKSKIIRY